MPHGDMSDVCGVALIAAGAQLLMYPGVVASTEWIYPRATLPAKDLTDPMHAKILSLVAAFEIMLGCILITVSWAAGDACSYHLITPTSCGTRFLCAHSSHLPPGSLCGQLHVCSRHAGRIHGTQLEQADWHVAASMSSTAPTVLLDYSTPASHLCECVWCVRTHPLSSVLGYAALLFVLGCARMLVTCDV